MKVALSLCYKSSLFLLGKDRPRSKLRVAYFVQSLTLSNMLATIADGALALGSSIYGAIASSEKNKKAQQLIQQQRDDNRAWHNTRMSEDYTQRSDAQAVINKQKALLQQQYNNARAANIVAGGTDESLVMQTQAANNSLAQTMSDIASEASAHKDNIEKQYRAQDAALNQQQAQIAADQAKATAQAASQATNAGLNLMGAGMLNNNGISNAAEATARLKSLGIKSPEELAKGIDKIHA